MQQFVIEIYPNSLFGGDDKRSGYVLYVQGIQPNVPARTTFIDIYSRIGITRHRLTRGQIENCLYMNVSVFSQRLPTLYPHTLLF